MLAEKNQTLERKNSLSGKLSDYVQFTKLRLSLLVVFSAGISFIIASHGTVNWASLAWLITGGFLVTGSSNGFNQIIEKDLDKLMDRTANRPLPQGRMSVTEGLIVSGIMGIMGISILYHFMNPLSGILGAMALLLYTVVYTPLKRVTPFAVFVGAFPGAIPPMLGWVATQQGFGEITFPAFLLFVVQFMWQFPHFWAIAWVMDDDYKKAGFRMLPSPGGRDKSSAFQAFTYTLFLLPISLSPVFFGVAGKASAAVILIAGCIFAWQAYRLYRDCSTKAASKLMFGSFIYLPIVQLALLIG